MALILTHSLGKVRRILPSADEATFAPAADESVLINPVLPACDQRYMVVENNAVREQTQAEKDADLAAIAAAQAAFDAKVKVYTDALKAKWDALGTAITTLQGQIDTFPASPTTAQMRSGLITTAQDLVNLAKLLQDTRPMLEEFYKDWAGRQP